MMAMEKFHWDATEIAHYLKVCSFQKGRLKSYCRLKLLKGKEGGGGTLQVMEFESQVYRNIHLDGFGATL